MKFSKHTPACPDAARNDMHVILPFANLDAQTIHDAYCSVQCQDYPTNKVTIYVYQDGDNANKSLANLRQQQHTGIETTGEDFGHDDEYRHGTSV